MTLLRRFAVRWLALAALGWLAAGAAQALGVASVSPQGEVAQARQVVVRFKEDAVRFGDARAAAPFAIGCEPAATARGQGRWNGAREWVYEFGADLPPGTRCQVTPLAGFKSPAGTPLAAAGYRFSTGGPFVQRIVPDPSQEIEEEQAFVLRLNGAATPDSLAAHLWCAVDGLAERVPARPLAAESRTALLAHLGWAAEAERAPQRFAVVQCARRLTPGSRVQLVYGAGVATPGGVASRVERRFAYRVRAPFTASLQCQRENAQAGCLPIRPLELVFSAPVPRRLAALARLRGDKLEHAPQLDGAADADALVERLTFAPPLAERSAFTLSLPPDLRDGSGRPLANAASFPLRVATGPLPPLAKFAAAPFGIVERFAEGPDGTALLPLTLRYVEPPLRAQALPIAHLQPQSDADIIAWFTRVQRYDEALVPRAWAASDLKRALPPPVNEATQDMVESRTLSLLQGAPGVRAIELPPAATAAAGGGAVRRFEVVGVPLPPGFHVLELASPRLGQSLLSERYGEPRPMVVRTSALVTNLGVHFKLGRAGALAWVTALDSGQPVAGAAVQVSDCRGRALAQARTDAQGMARFAELSAEPPRCELPEFYADFQQAYFVSARAQQRGAPDMAFTWSSWQRGIEPWRFNVPVSQAAAPELRAHTVFDRVLLRAGDTLSMKHLLRTETPTGFGLPGARPATLVITHVGSGQQFTQPITWRATASGGRSAESSFAIPVAARLGLYQVALRLPRPSHADAPEAADAAHEGELLPTGQFRVEEFRLPVLQGRIAPAGSAPLVAAASVPLALQLAYVAGGPAAQLPVRVSALTRAKALRFADHEAFSFEPPRPRGDGAQPGDAGDEQATAPQAPRVVADKLPLTLDRQGQGQLTLTELPPAERAQELVLEASYADPSGELQTLRGQATLWPAGVIAGVRAEGWVSAGQSVKLQALALDLAGKPKAGVPLDVKAIARITTTSRKRLVGGFYAYDNRTDTRDLGTVCTGRSDARGLLVCDARLTQPGEIELVASARDEQGRQALAATSVWVTRQGELWFGGDNHDRMDVLAEKPEYAVGDTVRLQVRMPFRRATALVTVEREGIVDARVVELRGDDPTVTLKVGPHWSPNVYVSVLALRGRLVDVPWYSFFTWGYQRPRDWWQAFWHDSQDYVAPGAMVDLSKPAFRLGMAELRIGSAAHRLDVDVQPDKAAYPVRATARVAIQARLPNGQPAAGAEVALAAVDEALLELLPNRSWDLLEAMLQRRAWGVQTATAQMEIVGRRHYGRKAVPAGGDGGAGAPTRELLDTLLLWRPRVPLDAQGRASVELPLNDALTRFRVVAIADHGTGLFGTGSASLRTTQDLQILSGLPPLVRAGDRFRALLTVRNTTQAPMQVRLAPRARGLELAPQQVELPAGEARELAWDVSVPPALAAAEGDALDWQIEASDAGSGARDALKVTQRVLPAVPVTVQQATLTQLDGRLTQPVAPPAGALPGRGGVQLSLRPSLTDGLPGVRDWFARYPYACLEQKAAVAIGLRDAQRWQQLTAQLPAYLDGDGLAYYFPPRAGDADRGSDTLTAALLSASQEAARLDPAFALPDALRAQMLAGLAAFVEGRIERSFWAPRADLDVRKIAALEALARHGAAQPAMLGSITVAPQQWPTSAVIDWINVLKRLPPAPNLRAQLQQAEQVLRARLAYQGTRLVFSSEAADHWWWLMAGPDVNAARLLLTVLGEPGWQDDLGRIAGGLIARQQGGAWSTTTANLWGSLALAQFARARQAQPVSGSTRAALGEARGQIDWPAAARGQPASAPTAAAAANQRLLLPWPAGAGGQGTLSVSHEGSGQPWLTLQSLAAVPLTAPVAAGYQVKKSVARVEPAAPAPADGAHARGDLLRVTLEVTASADMSWVAVTDPLPAGATVLGSGLGRDSLIGTLGERREGAAWPAYEERSFEAFRAYYEYVPKGTLTLQYTLRLNSAGRFQLPPTRVEALYAPEMHGLLPNAPLTVR